MEMTDRLSTLPQQAQLKVMETAFKKMSLSFGVQVFAKWQGLDMKEVYADWASSMQDFSLGSINHGIEQAGDLQHPPSKGEFKTLCQGYKPKLPPMIDHHLSPEQIEKNKNQIADIVKMLANKKSLSHA